MGSLLRSGCVAARSACHGGALSRLWCSPLKRPTPSLLGQGDPFCLSSSKPCALNPVPVPLARICFAPIFWHVEPALAPAQPPQWLGWAFRRCGCSSSTRTASLLASSCPLPWAVAQSRRACGLVLGEARPAQGRL